MFGSVSEWFYKWLGGIQPHPEAVGFNWIVIRPETKGSIRIGTGADFIAFLPPSSLHS
jgi:hypothetical protein